MRIGGEDLLSWGGADPAQTLHALLQAIARLLHPDVGDSPSLGVGEVRRFASIRPAAFQGAQTWILSRAAYMRSGRSKILEHQFTPGAEAVCSWGGMQWNFAIVTLYTSD